MPDDMPPSAAEEPLADPGSRFVAALIDAVFVGVCFAVPVVGPIVGVVYGLVKDALPFLDGQSLGKRAMGIRVVKDPGGAPITEDWVTSILRQLSLCIPLFNLVDACMVFSSRRQRFGDRWARTIVVIRP